MANTSQESKTLRLYKYQPTIVDSKDQDNPKKEWHRRLENFLRQQVYMCPISSLNDPFEGTFIAASDFRRVLSEQNLFDFHLKLFQKQADQIGKIVSANEFRELISSADFQQRYLEDLSRADGFFASYGALCLTQSYSNIPMWALYSSDHQGYCVMFDLDIGKLCELSTLTPAQSHNYVEAVCKGQEMAMQDYDQHSTFFFTKVNYTPKIPSVSIDDYFLIESNPHHNSYELHKKFIQQSIGTKLDKWSYEEEYRLFANFHSTPDKLMSLTLTPYLKVSGIIIGAKVNDAEKHTFHDLCAQYKLPLHQARFSDRSYEIDVDLIKDYSI